MFEKAFFMLLTKQCNMKCPHCYNSLDSLKNTEQFKPLITLEKFTEILSTLKDQGFKKVLFSGGEAILHPDLVEIVAEAHRKGIKTALFTNGKGLHEQLITQLAEVGLDEIRISFNELVWITNREQYSRIIREKVRYLDLIKKYNIGLGYIYIISKRNIAYTLETYEYLEIKGVSMKIQPLYLPENDKNYDDTSAACIPEDEWEKLQHNFVELQKKDEQFAKHNIVYGELDEILQYLDLLIDVYCKQAIPSYCPTGPLLVIDSDGELHPCLFRYDISVGSIYNENDIASISGSLDQYIYFQNGQCYHEECLSAYR